MSQIIIITGPSGAGKSSVGKALAEQLAGTWALISQDGMREFIKAGYVHADVEWTDETRKQWEVAIAICCDMIKRYHEAGINCIVELFAPPSEFEKWEQRLGDLRYRLIVLLPSVEETVHRNANRPLKMQEAKIRENHDWFTQWKPSEATIIDTSRQTLKETTEKIRQTIASSVD